VSEESQTVVDPVPDDEVVVRPPRASELRRLADIENSGLPLFTDWFGEDKVGDALRSPAPTGPQRADAPGFLLVVGKPVVGFVHVLHLDGFAHLEQVSVVPEAMRRKVGTALVRAAMREAEAEGFTQLSLCTYRDVPWNAPFYERLGFRVVEDLLPFQRRLRVHEIALGLDESGERVVMSADLSPTAPRPPGITVEPERGDPFAVVPVVEAAPGSASVEAPVVAPAADPAPPAQVTGE